MNLPEDETKPGGMPAPGSSSPSEEPRPDGESTPSGEQALPAEMFPGEEALPEGFTPMEDLGSLPRARRRRARRSLISSGEKDRSALLESLARRAFPSFEFFLFSLLSGAVLGAGYLLDSPALLLLGLLLAPLLTPWAGMLLASLTGAVRFFLQTSLGLAVAGLIVFLTGVLAGFAGQLWMPLTLFHADIHAHLWWPDFLVITLGAALLAISFTRLEQKPILPSILLAYGLFLPLNAAGLGFGLGEDRLFPAGLGTFLVYLSLAVLVGLAVLRILRFRSSRPTSFLLTLLLLAASLSGLIGLTGAVGLIRSGITSAYLGRPTATAPSLPSVTPSSTFTRTPSPEPSGTPTQTATPEPTPSYALIQSPAGGGALLRIEPGTGTVITALENGRIVQVYAEIQTIEGRNWVHVRSGTVDGWVLQTVLAATSLTPTPLPTGTASATP